jgi:putative spermidine/putrescine transport system permease protein
MTQWRAGRGLGIYIVLVCCFSVAPVVVILLESVTAADYISFPPQGFSLKWYIEIGRRPEFLDSLQVSAIVATVTALGATTIGTLASMALVRHRFPGRTLLQGLFMAPLSLPALVLGIALLRFYVAADMPRDTMTLVMAHLVVTTPFAIRLVTVSLTGLDPNLERAANSLGAGRWRTFRYVTLPVIRPGIVASLLFTFIISFDEVAVSLFLSSPSAMTLPVRVFAYIEQNYDPFITSISSILVLFAVAMTVVLEKTVGIGRIFGLR